MCVVSVCVTWVGGARQPPGAADAGGQEVGGGVLRLAALLRAALAPWARAALGGGEPAHGQAALLVEDHLL